LLVNNRAGVGDLDVARLVTKNDELDALLVAQLLDPTAKRYWAISLCGQIFYERAFAHGFLAFVG
jgi:hypothetical protein